jgi:hypothetical protein
MEVINIIDLHLITTLLNLITIYQFHNWIYYELNIDNGLAVAVLQA